MKLKFFDSLSTLPIFNFYKVKFSGSLLYLLKEENIEVVNVTKEEFDTLRKLWVKLEAEFIDRFAMNEYFRKSLGDDRILVTTRHGSWCELNKKEYDMLQRRDFDSDKSN